MRRRLAKISGIVSALIMVVVVVWFANQWFGWFATDFFSRPAPRDMRALTPFTDIVWGAGVDDILALYGKPNNYNGSNDGAYASVTYQREILGQTARARYEWQEHKLYQADFEFSLADVAYADLAATVEQFTMALTANLHNPQSLHKERQRQNLPYEPVGPVWFYDEYIWDENSLVALNCHWSDAEQQLHVTIDLSDARKFGLERWLMQRSALQPEGLANLAKLASSPLPPGFMAYPWGVKYGAVKKVEGTPHQDMSFPLYGGWREYLTNSDGFAYTVSYGFPWRKLANVNYNMDLYGVPKAAAQDFADNLALQIATVLGHEPCKSTAREIQNDRQNGVIWRGGAQWLNDETFVLFGVFWNEFAEHMFCYMALGDVKSSLNAPSLQMFEPHACEPE